MDVKDCFFRCKPIEIGGPGGAIYQTWYQTNSAWSTQKGMWTFQELGA